MYSENLKMIHNVVYQKCQPEYLQIWNKTIYSVSNFPSVKDELYLFSCPSGRL